MAQRVPRDAPWTAPNAREHDGQTFETWRNANTVSEGGRFLIAWAPRPCSPSSRATCRCCSSSSSIAAAGNETTPGDFNRLLNTAGGAQESRLVGGAQTLPDRMAERLGDGVILSAPVRRIAQDDRAVTIDADGVKVVAHR
jgi:monoamine oxidase